MAHEFCATCRPFTKSTCSKCPKTRQRYESTATSAMSDYKWISFMGRAWWPAEHNDEEHY